MFILALFFRKQSSKGLLYLLLYILIILYCLTHDLIFQLLLNCLMKVIQDVLDVLIDGEVRMGLVGLQVSVSLDFVEEGIDKKLKLLFFHDDELVPVLL